MGESPRNAGTGGARPRVLVVDDDEPTMQMMVAYVKFLGHPADGVIGGAEAVEKVRGGGIGILLLDCMMPGMDGFEAARRIRGLQPPPAARPWIIALTGQRDEGTKTKCRGAGMDDFLLKPVTQDQLKEALARAR